MSWPEVAGSRAHIVFPRAGMQRLASLPGNNGASISLRRRNWRGWSKNASGKRIFPARRQRSRLTAKSCRSVAPCRKSVNSSAGASCPRTLGRQSCSRTKGQCQSLQQPARSFARPPNFTRFGPSWRGRNRGPGQPSNRACSEVSRAGTIGRASRLQITPRSRCVTRWNQTHGEAVPVIRCYAGNVRAPDWIT